MTRKWASLTILASCLVLVNKGYSQSSELESFVDSLADEHIGATLAGMSVGVMRGDQILLKKSYGLASLEWQVPMPMDAIHEVGSVTKQFTTFSILQLYGQERLDLDADVTAYLPELDLQERSVSVRRLMNHTSGIKGFTEMEEFRELSLLNRPREELLELIEQYPFDFEPGEALIYNNSAYMLMGLIIETVTGQSYEEYLEENVFPLANMANSSYCSNRTVVEQRASGYSLSDGEFVMARYHDHVWPYAAGSVCSTVSDLLAWNRALHTGEILSPNLYELLVTPIPLNDGSPVRYASGMVSYTHPTGRVIEHGGAIDGFLSHSRYYPDEDVTVVVLLNTAGPTGPASIANDIGENLFGTPFLPEENSYAGDLSRFAGEYRGAARGTTLRVIIELEGDNLQATQSTTSNTRDPQVISYLEGNTFYSGNNLFYFDEDVNGEISRLRIDSLLNHYVLKSTHAP